MDSDSPNTHLSVPVLPQPERRRFPRYSVQVPIEIHREGNYEPVHLESTELSRGGCYIRPGIPFPVGIRVQATLWLDGYTVVIHGRVVTRHPEFGNGIMFVDFEGQAEPLLDRYLAGIVA